MVKGSLNYYLCFSFLALKWESRFPFHRESNEKVGKNMTTEKVGKRILFEKEKLN